MALVVEASGCGNVGDASIHADAIDATPQGTAVVITQAALSGHKIGDTAPGIHLFSTRQDGALFGRATTDDGGHATVDVTEGGSVTALYPHTADGGADLITWAGVKPGDTLTFGSRSFSATSQDPLGTQTYSWPMLAGATQYAVATSCAPGFFVPAPTLSLSITETASCHREPMEVVFLAFNGSGVLGAGSLANVVFANGGAVALSAWTTTKPATVSLTGLPLEVSTVSGQFRPVIDGATQVSGPLAFNGAATGGALSQTFNWTPVGDRTIGAVTLFRPGFVAMQLLDSFPTNTLVQTVAAPPLPSWGQGRTAASSALRAATWYAVADAKDVTTGQLLHLGWTRMVTGTSQPSQWDLILPPGQMSIGLPALPPEVDAMLPASQDFLSASTRVFNIPAVESYDALRARPSRDIMCLECALASGDLQRAVYTQF